jgi:hypothetical protein
MFGAQHDKLCYSIGDAAKLLSVRRRTLYREIAAGRIVRLGYHDGNVRNG